MNLSNIADKVLLNDMQNLVQSERELLTKVLHHLKEIDSRRLYSSLGFSSLFDYCVKSLKYSESQALRRISAARLLKEIPEVEEKIATGALSLTNVSQAQSFFRAEKKENRKALKVIDKKEVLKELENCSSREGQRRLLSKASNPEKATKQSFERKRLLTPQLTELRLAVDNKQLDKINKLKGLLAHKHPGPLGHSELLDILCDIAIEKLDPANATTKVKKKPEPKLSTSRAEGKSGARKYIAVSLRRKIWQRAKSQCENCGSQQALEIDHVKPIAKGGAGTEKNLRLLCRSCNQRSAIEQLGEGKMRVFLEASDN